ncbi:MAG: DUF2007 domain-containing protein [Chthonomonas sp.]|nr:DUF2007 domain-containing protein [Chthonomonas sp.]
MVRVFSDPLLANVAIVQGRLDQAGIEAMVKNQLAVNTQFNAGINTTPEFWPEIWVNEADRDQAIDLIQEFQAGTPSGTPWTCTSCGEEIEGQFDACWNCGAERATG